MAEVIPKRRYAALDGLRGVAALLVVFYHLETHTGHWPGLHGYVAVDLFFALSGFVIALNYETGLASGMRLGAFAWIRFKRLYPMMLLGGALGLGVAIFQGNTGLVPKTLAEVVWFPMLFSPVGLYPLNNVQWSLLFEVLANAVHATLLRSLSTRALALITVAGGLCVLAIGLTGASLGGGWTGATFGVGLARMAFSYTLGVLLWRIHKAGKLPISNMPFGLIALGMVVAVIAGSMHRGWGHFGDLGLILIALPAVLIAGIGARESRWLRLPEKWLGELSFPIYAIHYPLITLWVALKWPVTYATETLVICAVLALSVGAARLDRGVRDWLSSLHLPRRRVALS